MVEGNQEGQQKWLHFVFHCHQRGMYVPKKICKSWKIVHDERRDRLWLRQIENNMTSSRSACKTLIGLFLSTSISDFIGNNLLAHLFQI